MKLAKALSIIVLLYIALAIAYTIGWNVFVWLGNLFTSP